MRRRKGQDAGQGAEQGARGGRERIQNLGPRIWWTPASASRGYRIWAHAFGGHLLAPAPQSLRHSPASAAIPAVLLGDCSSLSKVEDVCAVSFDAVSIVTVSSSAVSIVYTVWQRQIYF